MTEVRDPRRPDNTDAEIGRSVRARRKARGLSKTELANQIGVTFKQIKKYERGANRISLSRLTRIAHVLGAAVSDLLGGSRRPTRSRSRNKEHDKLADPRKPDDLDVELGRLLRVERIARGLSQTELGNLIGVTFQQIQKYESGANRLPMGRLVRIAKILGVDVTYLLGGGQHTVSAGRSDNENVEFAEAIRLLGRIGALRLLRAFHALPSNPQRLRESIVEMVEATAFTAQRSGGRSARAHKRR